MLTTIRKATVNDKTRIMEIYAYARQFMAEHGNPNQWKNNNPSEETIDNDIANRQMYVIEADGGVHAVFYFHIGDDSTYHIIDNGHWLSDESYGTIHRIAGDGTIHGVLEIAVNYCKDQIHCAKSLASRPSPCRPTSPLPRAARSCSKKQ